MVIGPVGSYELFPGSHPFVGGTRSSNRSAAIRALREMVLNSVVSEHSKQKYAKALDEVFTLVRESLTGDSRALSSWNIVLPWWRKN